jgi:hypothetical protein
MTEKPIVSKPRMIDFSRTDEELSRVFESVEKKVLNIHEWGFPNENETKSYTYLQVLELVKPKFLCREGVSVLKSLFKWLPFKLRNLREDLNTIFKKYLISLQDLVNLLKEFEEYNGFLESEVSRLKGESDSVNNLKVELEVKREVSELKSKLDEAEKIIKDLKGEKPVEKEELKDEKKKDRRSY